MPTILQVTIHLEIDADNWSTPEAAKAYHQAVVKLSDLFPDTIMTLDVVSVEL